jgi:hypothetical protein
LSLVAGVYHFFTPLIEVSGDSILLYRWLPSPPVRAKLSELSKVTLWREGRFSGASAKVILLTTDGLSRSVSIPGREYPRLQRIESLLHEKFCGIFSEVVG